MPEHRRRSTETQDQGWSSSTGMFVIWNAVGAKIMEGSIEDTGLYSVNLPVVSVGISTPISKVLDVLALITVIGDSSEIFTVDIILS